MDDTAYVFGVVDVPKDVRFATYFPTAHGIVQRGQRIGQIACGCSEWRGLLEQTTATMEEIDGEYERLTVCDRCDFSLCVSTS